MSFDSGSPDQSPTPDQKPADTQTGSGPSSPDRPGSGGDTPAPRPADSTGEPGTRPGQSGGGKGDFATGYFSTVSPDVPSSSGGSDKNPGSPWAPPERKPGDQRKGGGPTYGWSTNNESLDSWATPRPFRVPSGGSGGGGGGGGGGGASDSQSPTTGGGDLPAGYIGQSANSGQTADSSQSGGGSPGGGASDTKSSNASGGGGGPVDGGKQSDGGGGGPDRPGATDTPATPTDPAGSTDKPDAGAQAADAPQPGASTENPRSTDNPDSGASAREVGTADPKPEPGLAEVPGSGGTPRLDRNSPGAPSSKDFAAVPATWAEVAEQPEPWARYDGAFKPDAGVLQPGLTDLPAGLVAVVNLVDTHPTHGLEESDHAPAAGEGAGRSQASTEQPNALEQTVNAKPGADPLVRPGQAGASAPAATPNPGQARQTEGGSPVSTHSKQPQSTFAGAYLASMKGDAGLVQKAVDGSKKEAKPRTRVEVPPAKGSQSYSDADLKAPPGSNMQTERRGHTRKAEAAASADVKTAAADRKRPITDAEAKVAGQAQKVQHHHHAAAAAVKETGMNPDVPGERSRLTALSSQNDTHTHGTIGDSAKAADNQKLTHHNVVERMDLDDRTRTAKAMGVPGENPKLPATEAGRRGLVDASGTSRWRVPATIDQTERKVERAYGEENPLKPETHKFTERGEVIGGKNEGATARMEATEKPRPWEPNPLTTPGKDGNRMTLGPDLGPGGRMTPMGAAGGLIDWRFVGELGAAATGRDLEARAKHSDVLHLTPEQREQLRDQRAATGEKSDFDNAVSARARTDGVSSDVAEQRVRADRAQVAKERDELRAKDPKADYIGPPTYVPPPKSWAERVVDFLNNPLGR